MKRKKMIDFKRFIRHISVMLLLFGILNLLLLETQHVSAQTGAPPPPTEPVFLPPVGSLLIDPIFPALPPANIPPLVGNGALAVIPQNAENAIALVNIALSNGIRATLLVPASDESDLVAKIQEVDVVSLPAAALPVAFTSALNVFQITIFDAVTGELLTTHNPALQFGMALSPGVHPEDVVLLYFNSSENKYEIIDLTGDPIKGIVKAEITESSTSEDLAQAELNQYSPFALVRTAVSPDLAKADTGSDSQDTPAQGETIAKVLATPTLSQVDTTASAEQISTQEGDSTANRTLFDPTPESDESDRLKSTFGTPVEDKSSESTSETASDKSDHLKSIFGTQVEKESSSESTSEATPPEEASVASAYDSVENKSSQGNNSPLLNGFALLITSLGAGFGFFRSRLS